MSETFVGTNKSTEQVFIGNREVGEIWIVPHNSTTVNKVFPPVNDKIVFNSNISNRKELYEASSSSFSASGHFIVTGSSPVSWSLQGDNPQWVTIDSNGTVHMNPPLQENLPVNHTYHFRVVGRMSSGSSAISNEIHVMVPYRAAMYRIQMERGSGSTFMNIEEIQMLDISGHSWGEDGRISSDQSSVYDGNSSSYGGHNAWDWSNTKFWHTRKGSGHWITGRWNSRRTLKRVAIRPRPGNPDRAPAVIRVEALQGASWRTLLVAYPGYHWADHKLKYFDLY